MLPTVQSLLISLFRGAALVAAFAVYGADKRRAKQGRWRVPEKTLFLLAIVGGSVGALLGMWTFHHKTRHWYFRYGIPAILVVQLALAGWLSKLAGLGSLSGVVWVLGLAKPPSLSKEALSTY